MDESGIWKFSSPRGSKQAAKQENKTKQNQTPPIQDLFCLNNGQSKTLIKYPIGPLHNSVTWYKITRAGEQVALCDVQNKGRSGWTGTTCIVLEVPLGNLRTIMCDFVPWDRIAQRAYYWKLQEFRHLLSLDLWVPYMASIAATMIWSGLSNTHRRWMFKKHK